MRRLYLCVLLLFLACLAFAQTAPTTPTPPAPAPAVAPAKPVPDDKPPALSENESLQLDNLQLRATILQQQFNDSPPMRQVVDQFNQLTQKLNQEHPGWVFNQQTKTFAKAPEPAKPAPPAPAAPPEAKK